MRILMAQTSPCIRAFKEAVALTKLGHEVHLACYANMLETMYGIEDQREAFRSEIRLYEAEDLLNVAPWFDVVHCHNEPDTFALVMAASDVPSVHDTHELMSVRGGIAYNRIEEAIANKYSDARVHVSDYQAERTAELYGEHLHAIVTSGVLEDHIPETRLPKLGMKTATYHCVYEGGLNFAETTHRYCVRLFKELVDEGMHVHAYALCSPDVKREYRTLIPSDLFEFHDPLPTRELIAEMTQYDFGLCLFNVTPGNKHHLNSTLPNKLYDYLAAGLPVIASPLEELTKFLNRHKCGMCYTTAKEVREIAQSAIEYLRINPYEFTMERSVKSLPLVYETIVRKARPRLGLRFEPVPLEEVSGQWLLRFDPEEGSSMVPRALCGLQPSEETVALEAIIANGAFEEM